MTPSRSRRPPPPHAGGVADEAGGDQGELVAPPDIWMSGLESPGGGGGGAGRAGDDGRRNSLGQSENATLRKIEASAQMEVSEWRPVDRGDHARSERAVKVASAEEVPRSRHRLPAPHQLLCLSTLVHCLHTTAAIGPAIGWHRLGRGIGREG